MGNWKVLPVNGQIPADLIVAAGTGPTLITNTDVVNPIFISDDPGMYASQQNAIQLNPQSTMVVDGQADIYALAAAGQTVNANVVPGGMSFFQSTILGTSFIINKSGAFFYAGTPGINNLVASIAAQGGNDAFNNSYLPGVVSYLTGGPYFAVQIGGGTLSFFISSGTEQGASPWTQYWSISSQSPGVLNFQPINVLVANAVTNFIGGLNVNGALLQALNGLSVSGGETADQINVQNSGNNPLIQATQLTGASTAVIQVVLPVVAAQALAYSLKVTGDANNRMALDIDGSGNPRIRWGSGSAAPDTILSHTGANLLSLLQADFDIGSIGRGLRIAEGTNGRMGITTLVAGNSTVACNTVTGNTRIFLSRMSAGGTLGQLSISSVTVGTNFTIHSSNAADTSDVVYLLLEPG